MSNLPDGCAPDDIDREMEGGDIEPPIYDGLRCPHCNAIQTLEDENLQFCSSCLNFWD